MRVRAQKNLARRGYDILFWQEGGAPNTTLVALPMEVTMEPVDEHLAVSPSMVLDFDMAQELFQSLWDEGMRPLTAEGTSAHIASLNMVVTAQREHIRSLEQSHQTLLASVQTALQLPTGDRSAGERIRDLLAKGSNIT